MKKKILLIIFISCILIGCTPLQDEKLEDIVNISISNNLKVYNTSRKGYKYNLPKGLSVTDNTDFNEIISSKYYDYYLYIDGISYYNKIIELYEENETSYKSMSIIYEDKFGYLEINKLKSGKYLIEIMYNYAKIEVVVKESDINVAVSYAINILNSVQYNTNVLKNMLSEESTQTKEFDFDIFETASDKDSEYLEAIETDIYEDEVHDNDLIEQEGE